MNAYASVIPTSKLSSQQLQNLAISLLLTILAVVRVVPKYKGLLQNGKYI